MNARRLRRIAALHASLAREYEMEAAEQDPPKDVYVMRDGVPWAWQARDSFESAKLTTGEFNEP